MLYHPLSPLSLGYVIVLTFYVYLLAILGLCWLDVLVSMILEIFLEKKKYETD